MEPKSVAVAQEKDRDCMKVVVRPAEEEDSVQPVGLGNMGKHPLEGNHSMAVRDIHARASHDGLDKRPVEDSLVRRVIVLAGCTDETRDNEEIARNAGRDMGLSADLLFRTCRRRRDRVELDRLQNGDGL